MDRIIQHIYKDNVPDAVISENIFDCYEEEASSSQEEIQDWAGEIAAGAQ